MSIEGIELDNLPFASLVISENGNIKSGNQDAECLLSGKRQNFVARSLASIFPDYQFLISQTTSEESIINHLGQSIQTLMIKDNGEQVTAYVRISNQQDNTLLFIERTDRTLDDAKVTDDDASTKLTTSIEEAFWEWDIENDIMYYSAKVMALLGYEAVAHSAPKAFWEDHVAEEYLALVYEQFDEHLAGELPCISVTHPVTTKCGDKRWVAIVGKVFEYKSNNPYKMFGSVKDVTNSHELVEQLEVQNNYLQLAERLSNTGHWRIDLTERELYWSSGIYSIHGVNREDFTPDLDNVLSFYVDAEQKRVKDYIETAIATKQGFHFKSTIIQPLGNKVKVEALGEVEVDNRGKVVGIFGVFRDVTKAEETFEKLKLLAMVNYTIKVPIFFIDDKDNIVYQDLSPQIGNKSSVLFNYINFSITEYLEYKRKAKEQGQIKRTNISFDNFTTVYDMSITYEADEGIYIWIVENVTEKFRKDQQQIISNRLALLGNTFGTVSHDINNVLGVALGAIEMLELKYAQGETNISNYINRVKNAIDKGKGVTERLLAFTRKPSLNVVLFDPVKEIEENQYLFKQLLLSTINLEFDISHVDCLIKFPQAEFINIILNLVLNAQDAIREEGLLGSIQISANINSQQYLEIHIRDSGIGIENVNLSKIFDPFYSSKSVNKGNGIGLANVYNTIYKYNGEIRVEGKCDLGGAHFTLQFKCDQNQKSAIQTNAQSTALLGIVNKSILILDDELSIAEFVALFLESSGARTNHVTSKSGLISTLEGSEHYDIFITDMILPDISGREATELVLKKFPNIKVYSMSGYIAEEDNKWQYPVLRKPFNSKELANFLVKN